MLHTLHALFTIPLFAISLNAVAQTPQAAVPSSTSNTQKVTSVFSPTPDWKFNTHVALLADNVISKQYYTTSIGTYVSTVEEESDQSQVDAILAAFAGVSGQMRNGQRLGVSLGSGFGILSLRPKLLFDMTLSFGPDQRFIALAGVSLGQVTDLSSSVFQNEWGMVYRHHNDTITEVPLSKKAKLGYSFGLGWRLGQ